MWLAQAPRCEKAAEFLGCSSSAISQGQLPPPLLSADVTLAQRAWPPAHQHLSTGFTGGLLCLGVHPPSPQPAAAAKGLEP